MDSRTLRTRYIAALAAVALLSIMGQVLVQANLTAQESDSTVINLAGRQRMLSQRIVKTALIAVHPAVQPANDALASERWRELGELSAEWHAAHRGLRSGDPELGLSGNNSAAVRAAFVDLDDSYRGMSAAVDELLAHGRTDANAISQLLEHEGEFLRGMERIVSLYERESSARVRSLQHVELSLLGMVLVTLLLEGLLVFRPADRRIREALARLRAGQTELLRVAEGERTRIGQDLHDGLCQHLAGLAMMAQTMSNRVDTGKVTEASALGPELATLAELLHAGLQNARRLSHSLFPEVLLAGGLVAALREVCAMATTLHNVACVCEADMDEPVELGSDTALQLYRIAQEAVSNAVRHSQANRIVVSLARDDASLRLRVTDNGIGLAQPSGQPRETSGIGLRSMAMRAHTIGAEFTLGDNHPTGTRVHCQLPLPC